MLKFGHTLAVLAGLEVKTVAVLGTKATLIFDTFNHLGAVRILFAVVRGHTLASEALLVTATGFRAAAIFRWIFAFVVGAYFGRSAGFAAMTLRLHALVVGAHIG